MKDIEFFNDIEYLLKAWQLDANADHYSMDIYAILSEIENRKKEQEIFFSSLQGKK